MSFEKVCKQVAIDSKSLNKKQLENKIVNWSLNSELKIYVHVLENEYGLRNDLPTRRKRN